MLIFVFFNDGISVAVATPTIDIDGILLITKVAVPLTHTLIFLLIATFFQSLAVVTGSSISVPVGWTPFANNANPTIPVVAEVIFVLNRYHIYPQLQY